MDKPIRFSNRLSTKFTGGIAAILLVTMASSLFVNTKVAQRYYLRQQSVYVRQVGLLLEQALSRGTSPEEAVAVLEETEQVLITYSANTSDYDRLSGDLRVKFRDKGLGFQKFWLWEQDYLSAAEQGYKFRLYQQDKLNYGILVEYIPIGPNLYAIAAIIPNASDIVGIINYFGILVYSLALMVAITLIYFLVRHITRPLHEMEQFARKISAQEYDSLTISTRDELEVVADSMNQMSHDIQQYQRLLLDKNRQMEQLLDSVAHDLKTPISLIGMYAAAIRDRMDDGTFLDTIIRQNSRMAQLVEGLLHLSRIGQKEVPAVRVPIGRLLSQAIEEQRILADGRGLGISAQIDLDAVADGNPEMVSALFSNLLSNALKYADGETVEIMLEKAGLSYRFVIANESDNGSLDLEYIWEPFYVGEASRNKELSGTGLGLSIVKRIVERSGYSISCERRDGRIQFEVMF